MKKNNKNIMSKMEYAQINYFIEQKQKQQQAINEKRDKVNAYIAWLQFMTISMNVLIEDYWPKTAKKEIPRFLSKCMSLYESTCYNAVNFDEMEEYILKYADVNVREIVKGIKNEYIKEGIIGHEAL